MNSIQLSESEADRLEKIVFQRKIQIQNPKSQYEKLRSKDGNLNFILYNTLKLVFEETNDMVQLIKEIVSYDEIYEYIIGSDETGKGEWYGPLVVVALALKANQINEFRLLGVTDSKTLPISRIYDLAEKAINQKDIIFHKLILKPKKYNDLYLKFIEENKNLNDLMAWAHSAVIKDVLSKINSKEKQIKIIIDKFDFKKTEYRLKNLKSSNLKIIQKSKGESEIPVALASIVAKYYFELEVIELNNFYDLDLKKIRPQDLSNLSKESLYNIAKIHFKNVPF